MPSLLSTSQVATRLHRSDNWARSHCRPGGLFDGAAMLVLSAIGLPAWRIEEARVVELEQSPDAIPAPGQRGRDKGPRKKRGGEAVE